MGKSAASLCQTLTEFRVENKWFRSTSKNAQAHKTYSLMSLRVISMLRQSSEMCHWPCFPGVMRLQKLFATLLIWMLPASPGYVQMISEVACSRLLQSVSCITDWLMRWRNLKTCTCGRKHQDMAAQSSKFRSSQEIAVRSCVLPPSALIVVKRSAISKFLISFLSQEWLYLQQAYFQISSVVLLCHD